MLIAKVLIAARRNSNNNILMGGGLQEENIFGHNFAREVVHDVLRLCRQTFCEMDGSVQRLSNKRKDSNHWRMNFQVESFATRILFIIHDIKARVWCFTVIKTRHLWKSRSNNVVSEDQLLEKSETGKKKLDEAEFKLTSK
ncbi:hypothetical protein HAX54_023994 [Datura stramonium]|uniref:Uncharacterized protein n=1 Tax=Datura stramonium TaxID=4076 RepID=A0ABS8UZK2_DATST|nr:hypothetical protein [Datura stramonium]